MFLKQLYVFICFFSFLSSESEVEDDGSSAFQLDVENDGSSGVQSEVEDDASSAFEFVVEDDASSEVQMVFENDESNEDQLEDSGFGSQYQTSPSHSPSALTILEQQSEGEQSGKRKQTGPWLIEPFKKIAKRKEGNAKHSRSKNRVSKRRSKSSKMKKVK